MKSDGTKKDAGTAAYDHAVIEKKWQDIWEKTQVNDAKGPGGTVAEKTGEKKGSAKKFYSLIEFPYPSGDGLHVGHIRSNTAMDIISRKRRREGFDVLYPIGWDAFGLPTENYAIKTGIQPAVVTKTNTDNFRRQLKSLGFSFDWSREINTTDPKYYRWTQWIFLQFLKAGLAYKKKMAVNWCPKDLIVLANEEVIDGRCERCGTPVEKREKEQWMLAITKYADKLLAGLDATSMDVPADYVMPVLVDKVNPHQPGKPIIKRHVAHAIVFDPKTKKYLIIRNKKFGWDTVVIGGIEDGENAEETARREVREETGYTDLDFKRILGGPTEAHYYTKHKGENRIAFAQAAYFELKSDARVAIDDVDDKDKANEILWIDAADFVPGKMVNSELPIWLERLNSKSDANNGKSGQVVLDWSEPIKQAQRNWIGKSEGVNFKCTVKDLNVEVEMYNSVPQSYYAETFTVIAPDHPLVPQLVAGTDREKEVLAFVEEIRLKKSQQKFNVENDMEGIFTGRYIKNFADTGRDLPIWVASYVVTDYGTGIVNASAHDSRDFAFAKKFNISLHPVMFPADAKEAEKVRNLEYAYVRDPEAILAEPEQFKGRKWQEAREDIIDYIVKSGFGARKVNYKLRDWVFSRQRYWGEPIPVIHCEKCGVVPVPEKNLPVVLPPVKNYKPTETGESPLAAISEWVNVTCPKCAGVGKRETDTMPNWAGSSWYYLRYADPHNDAAFASPEALKYWMPVDWYNGGMEHTTLHLLYSRFWHKFLFDQGLVPTSEPYQKRTSHGLILQKGGEKMSKSKGNVISPDGIVEAVGADSLRLYEMFMGPFDQAIAWDENGIVGTRRFIEKVWKLQEKVGNEKETQKEKGNPEKTDILINKTVKKVSDDIEAMHFNTAVSALMIAANELEKMPSLSREHFEKIIGLMAPFTPHVAEEIWQNLGHETSIHAEPWPYFDPAKIAGETVKIMVQINGKTRASFEIDTRGAGEMTEAVAREKALALDGIKDKVYSKDIKKVIYVKGRLVNIVTQ